MYDFAFTRCVNARNVNDALATGANWLYNAGEASDSRAGSVVVSPVPVVTCYTRPTERVLFSPKRDANPFFHFMESLWMLAGRDDVKWISQFNSTFGQFSDDGKTFWGAYGRRWREWFGYDQLAVIIEMLRKNPEERRAVLAMWDGGYFENGDNGADLHKAIEGGKDVPCNTHIYFRIQDGRLHMMVNCRSNDIIWGAYGANAVHMSMLQEYVAGCVGVEVGYMWQNSWNYHAYIERHTLEYLKELSVDARQNNGYVNNPRVKPYPIMSIEPQKWNEELEQIFQVTKESSFKEPFFENVFMPMQFAWWLFKAKDFAGAFGHVENIAAYDWRIACRAWLATRQRMHEERGEE